jgi:hypothetical protein
MLLQNCIDLGSGERNEVIHLQMQEVSDVTEEENREPTTSTLTDPTVGFNLSNGTPGNVPGLSLLPIRLYPGGFPFFV